MIQIKMLYVKIHYYIVQIKLFQFSYPIEMWENNEIMFLNIIVLTKKHKRKKDLNYKSEWVERGR